MEWCVCGRKELYAGAELEGSCGAGGGEGGVAHDEVDMRGAVCGSEEGGHGASQENTSSNASPQAGLKYDRGVSYRIC